MALRKRAFGMALGTVWGLTVFVATIWATGRGQGETLGLLGGYYLGYSVTYVGAFVGLIWAFAHGFAGGAVLVWFYDLYSKAFYGSEVPGAQV